VGTTPRGKYIAEGALIAITGAACVIPDAWFLAGECFKAQGDPGAIWDAGQAWLDSAGQIGDAITAAIESFVVILIFAAIGVALAVWAGLILAAVASIVGNLGASEADAVLFVVECESVIRTLDTATTVTDGLLAGGIGAIMAGT
jgi:hypothetical protein